MLRYLSALNSFGLSFALLPSCADRPAPPTVRMIATAAVVMTRMTRIRRVYCKMPRVRGISGLERPAIQWLFVIAGVILLASAVATGVALVRTRKALDL